MRILTTYLLLNLIFFTGLAQSRQDEEDPDEEEVSDTVDVDDEYIRQNPVIDLEDYESEIDVPSFINLKNNKINFNGADWSKLINEIQQSATSPVSIVHIGDSHLQADFATNVVRDGLQYDFGNAGRGLITPLKMSGTNEPIDYSISSTHAWNAVKLMNQSWPRTMGFTGTSITPVGNQSNLLVSTSEKEDYNPFSTIIVFHKGQFYVTQVTDIDGNQLKFVATPSKDYTEIKLTDDINAARIYFDSAGDLTLFGVSLSGQRPGVFYHTIGNNGATFSTYNRIGDMGAGILPLSPDLVIISLGTNEAFGKVDKRQFKDSISRLVESIKKSNPNATLLLVTPMECQRSVYSKVSVPVKTRKRKKKRTRTKTVKSYKINSNISTVRDVIIEYAHQNHIAVYDWYNIAGGSHASEKWISAGLFSGDRVHHSLKGYKLQGELFYQALRDAFTRQSK
ncbi:MAG: GDSL-type esterase/lipase family protein [Bacteroides sp.]|nr:GDSL-type esterase/lipase family protein [Bacteroides sp.]